MCPCHLTHVCTLSDDLSDLQGHRAAAAIMLSTSATYCWSTASNAAAQLATQHRSALHMVRCRLNAAASAGNEQHQRCCIAVNTASCQVPASVQLYAKQAAWFAEALQVCLILFARGGAVLVFQAASCADAGPCVLVALKQQLSCCLELV